MTDALIVVGARLNSSRLPRKHFLELAGVPMIARIFERLAGLDANRVLATTADVFNRELVAWGQGAGIETFAFQGDVNDLVGRIDAVVRQFEPSRVVYVCGDCPLVCPDFIQMGLDALSAHPDWDMIGVDADEQGRKAIHEGIQCYSRDGWSRLVEQSKSALEREHVGLALSHGGSLTVGAIRERPFAYTGNPFRMSVDTAADWRFMSELYRRWAAFGRGPLPLEWAVRVVNEDPDLAAINSHVLQKSGYRNYGSACFLTEAGTEKGLGQLRRTVNLAERFTEETGLGCQVLIWGNAKNLGCLRTVNHEWITEFSSFVEAVSECVGNMLVLDLFPERLADPGMLREAVRVRRREGAVLVGIDRLHDWSADLDCVIVPTLFYDGPAPEHLVWGPEYALVRVWPGARWRQEVQGAGPLTVCTGGGDNWGYGRWLPEKLAQVTSEETQIRWVRGPFAPVPDVPAEIRHRWVTLEGLDNLDEVFAGTGVAVTVHGVTLLELLAHGIPTVVLPVPGMISEREWNHLKMLKGFWCLDQPESSLMPVRQLIDHPEDRAALHKEALGLGAADGLGNAVAAILFRAKQKLYPG